MYWLQKWIFVRRSLTLHKKLNFPLRISSVNMVIENLSSAKLHFLCSVKVFSSLSVSLSVSSLSVSLTCYALWSPNLNVCNFQGQFQEEKMREKYIN